MEMLMNRLEPVTPANQLRNWLTICGLSQRGAAGELDIPERQMREWCAGKGTPPRYVFLALAHLAYLRCPTK
jgi:hypothetical protein